MKILCSSGGTAGHVYPALSILHSFRTLCRHQGIGVELEWLGRGGSMSRKLVEAAGIRHRQVISGQIRSVNPLIQALSLIRVGFGTLQALWWVARFRPHCCLATGSNAAAPGAFAAYLLRIPLLYFMPDASPGLTDRLLMRVACKVLVGHEGALPHTRGKGVVTGYPLRASLLEAVKDRARARRTLAQALGPEFLSAAYVDGAALPLLLVSGGSLGARSLNNAVLDCLEQLLDHCVLLLISGEGEYPAVAARVRKLVLGPERQSRLKIVPYLHAEFAAALACADLAVMRSGASVLGELAVTCTPAVLVPLPGSGGHQKANAHALLAHEACMVLDNAELPERLWPTLESLLQHPEQRQAMAQRLHGLARSDGALRGAQAILEQVLPSIRAL